MARAAPAPRSRRRAGDQEARLVHAAGEGDPRAFARLYERYEQRVFDLAYRITGSTEDAAGATKQAFLTVLGVLPQLNGREFGHHLFAAARDTAYDLIDHPGSGARDTTPQPAALAAWEPDAGEAGGGIFEEDPELAALLQARQDEIREANLRLPPTQREVLALREREGMSYDQIADIVDVNLDSVAELISASRIDLHDALRGTVSGPVGAASEECRRATPLMAMRDDDQLDDQEEAGWLVDHLAHCSECRLRLDAMEEAAASYRAWAPVTATPLLWQETMAEAAELMGGEWGELTREPAVEHTGDGDEEDKRGRHARPARRATLGALGGAVGGGALGRGAVGGTAGALHAAGKDAGARSVAAITALRARASVRAGALGGHPWRDLPARNRRVLLALAAVSVLTMAGMLLILLGGDDLAEREGPVRAKRSAPSTEQQPAPEKIRPKRKEVSPKADQASNAAPARSAVPSPAATGERAEPAPRRRAPSRKRPARRRPPAAKVPPPPTTPESQATPPAEQPAPAAPPATPPAETAPVAPPPPVAPGCADAAGQPAPC